MNATAKKSCSNCGASINASAQFCHACGAKQGAESKPLSPGLIGLVALAVVVVVAVIAYGVGRSSNPAGSAAPFAAGGTGALPDLSNMSPREQADRLFNRVMTAHEAGDVAQMNQFAPMALSAYGNLGPLDPDAHYHVGLVQAITGNSAGALARADSMDAQVPHHLLAAMLRSSVAQMTGDTAAGLAASRDFLEHYDEQIVTGRQEYIDHQRGIEMFKSDAESRVGGAAK